VQTPVYRQFDPRRRRRCVAKRGREGRISNLRSCRLLATVCVFPLPQRAIVYGYHLGCPALFARRLNQQPSASPYGSAGKFAVTGMLIGHRSLSCLVQLPGAARAVALQVLVPVAAAEAAPDGSDRLTTVGFFVVALEQVPRHQRVRRSYPCTNGDAARICTPSGLVGCGSRHCCRQAVASPTTRVQPSPEHPLPCPAAPLGAVKLERSSSGHERSTILSLALKSAGQRDHL